MKSEAISANTAARDAEVYLAAAREVWHAGGAAGPLRLRVTSDSMRPLLRTGDEVVVQSSETHTLRPGDVLVVRRGEEWITHRLVAVDERGWHTHGDNTRYADEPASAAEIVGRVIAIERGTQTIDLQQPRWRAIDRRINRVQRIQLRVLAVGRGFGGTRSSGIQRGLAALINRPFQLAVRLLTRF
jgi:signal peptidase I